MYDSMYIYIFLQNITKHIVKKTYRKYLTKQYNYNRMSPFRPHLLEKSVFVV